MRNPPDWSGGIHHDGSAVYLSQPLPRAGDTVTFRLRVPLSAQVQRVYLRTMRDGELHLQTMRLSDESPVAQVWSTDMRVEQPRLAYRFKLVTPDGIYFYNARGVSQAEYPEKDDFRLVVDYDAPLWVRDQVFYQIFPDRFHNGDPSNDVQTGEYERRGKATLRRDWGEPPLSWEEGRSVDFYGGDLPGITQKLDYLAGLGISGIYLNPIFHATSNHKYDILDFYNVDAHLGGNEALIELREVMAVREMRLLLDVTTNHISFQNPWYTAFQDDPEAKTASFFAFDANGAIETWLGVPSLIKLNYTSETLRDWMYRQDDSVMRHWLKAPFAIDGWRLDVANMTGNLRMNQLDHEVWREMRPSLKSENPDVYIMGENFFDASMHLQGDELDATMNYPGFNLPVRRWLGGEDSAGFGEVPADTVPLPTEALAEQLEAFLFAVPYPIALQQFNQLDSHDTTRILHVVKGDKALVRAGVALLMAFPGVPCLYYGTEVGLDGGSDPDNRRCMPWHESEWDTDLLAYCKVVIAIRRESDALRYGGYQTLYAEGDTLAFMRHSPQQQIIFVVHRGDDDSERVAIPVHEAGLVDDTILTDLLNDTRYTVQDGVLTISGLTHGQALFLRVAQA